MKSKKLLNGMLALAIFLIGCGVGCFLTLGLGWDFQTRPYMRSNILQDIPEIKGSASEFLLDPYLDVTEENAHEVLQAYFSAPATLFFHEFYDDEATGQLIAPGEAYKIRPSYDDAPPATFGAIIQDAAITVKPISRETFAVANLEKGLEKSFIDIDSIPQGFRFSGILGQVSFCGDDEKTYIIYYPERRFSEGEAKINDCPTLYVLTVEGEYMTEIEKEFNKAVKKGKKATEKDLEQFK